MSHQAPGLLVDGDEVDRERARTEVLARAFAEAAGDYFKRLKKYEDAIADAEDTMDSMKKIGGGAVVVGLVLLLAGATSNPQSWELAGFGALVAIVGGAYAYIKYTNAQERIEKNEQNIKQNEPDGEVTFVSQVGVPLYLIPYQDRYMIFDGLDAAPQTTLDLASMDGDALVEASERFDEIQGMFEESLAGESVVSPNYAAQFSRDVTEHRHLERPLTDQMDRMTSIARDIDRETIKVSVHANSAKTKSVRTLTSQNLLRSDGDLPIVETRRTPDECEAMVDEIRGVEQEAVSGDMLDRAREQRQRVNEIATEHANRLQNNSEVVDEHFLSYSDKVATAMHKHVCKECLENEIEDIADELGLVDEILETGSLGNALSDVDLDKDVDEPFTQHIREDIEERIPELGDRLQEAYNTLEDLGQDGGYCNIHERVETKEIADSGAVFGEVWRSLYYAFREPILESAEELEREAEEARQTKEQKMIDLTQFEQIKEEVRREYESTKSEYEAARKLEQRLG